MRIGRNSAATRRTGSSARCRKSQSDNLLGSLGGRDACSAVLSNVVRCRIPWYLLTCGGTESRDAHRVLAGRQDVASVLRQTLHQGKGFLSWLWRLIP